MYKDQFTIIGTNKTYKNEEKKNQSIYKFSRRCPKWGEIRIGIRKIKQQGHLKLNVELS